MSFSGNIICTVEERKGEAGSYISKVLTPDNAKIHWMQNFLHHLFHLTVNPRKALTLDHAPEECGKKHMGRLSRVVGQKHDRWAFPSYHWLCSVMQVNTYRHVRLCIKLHSQYCKQSPFSCPLTLVMNHWPFP